jgi:hypothetical protein
VKQAARTIFWGGLGFGLLGVMWVGLVLINGAYEGHGALLRWRERNKHGGARL